MKIYFTASVGAKRERPELSDRYRSIVDKLNELGHKVSGDHVLGLEYSDIENVDDEFRVKYYRDMLKKINNSDMVVAEFSDSSASIGHEVTLALDKKIPVLILTEKGKVPQIFRALQGDDQLYIYEYGSEGELLLNLEDQVRNVKEGEDIRFNFLIPPSMVDYLEWVSKNRRIPKSVFLRDLITRELDNDSEFQSR